MERADSIWGRVPKRVLAQRLGAGRRRRPSFLLALKRSDGLPRQEPAESRYPPPKERYETDRAADWAREPPRMRPTQALLTHDLE